MIKKPTGNFKKKNNNAKPRVFVDQNSEESRARREKEGTVRGRVVEALPNAQFKIEYENGTKGIGYLGGKMKVYKIRVLVGDMIEAIVDPYSKKGRIVKRG
jgi:translation initiation factor IF-1